MYLWCSATGHERVWLSCIWMWQQWYIVYIAGECHMNIIIPCREAYRHTCFYTGGIMLLMSSRKLQQMSSLTPTPPPTICWITTSMLNMSWCSMLISNTANRAAVYCSQILTIWGHIYLPPNRSGNMMLGDPTSHRKQGLTAVRYSGGAHVTFFPHLILALTHLLSPCATTNAKYTALVCNMVWFSAS